MEEKQKKGALVTNAFLRTDKFVEHYEWLKKAAGQRNIALSLLQNTELLYTIETASEDNRQVPITDRIEQIAKEYDFILYWDKDIPLGTVLEDVCKEKGVPVFNTIESIAACDNKYETYHKLWQWNRHCRPEEKILLLPTIAAPMTYGNIGYTSLTYVDQIIESLGLPLVIKECYGSFGMQVYLAHDRKEVMHYTEKLAGVPFLYQKYQKESCGRDVRLQVVGDEVVAAMYRFSDNDFRANITNGGSMKRYAPTKQECELAVRTVQVLGLDFAGVDLLFTDAGKKGTAGIVCEVNSNAHFKNIYTCTGVNTAECIMNYIYDKVYKPYENV